MNKEDVNNHHPKVNPQGKKVNKEDVNNHQSKAKRKLLHLWIIILAGIRLMTNIFINGRMFELIDLRIKPSYNKIWKDDDVSRLNPDILKFKIELPHKSLKTEADKKNIKKLELLHTLNDNDDENWTFILQEIIDYKVSNITRKCRKTTKDGKTILEVENISHMKKDEFGKMETFHGVQKIL